MPATDLRRVPSIFITSLMLAIVGLFLFAALLNGQRDLAFLCLLVFGMAAGFRLWERNSFSGIRCSLSLDRDRIFAGEALGFNALVENRKLLPVLLDIRIPAGSLLQHSVSGGSVLKLEGSLLWYQAASSEWEVPDTRRGVHQLGPPKVISGDLCGFFQSEHEIAEPIQVVVYPKLVPLGPFYLRRRDFFGAPGGESPVDDPVYILGTTDYHHGRPARFIHWKASARHNRLQEKVYEPTEQEKVLFAVDVQQFAEKGAEEAFERTLEVVASLCVRLEKQGCAIGLLTNGAMETTFPPFVPIARSPRQASRVLEALAGLRMEPAGRLIDIMHRAARIPWGTSCVYIAFEEDAATHAVIARLRRRKTPVLLLTLASILRLRRDIPAGDNDAFAVVSATVEASGIVEGAGI